MFIYPHKGSCPFGFLLDSLTLNPSPEAKKDQGLNPGLNPCCLTFWALRGCKGLICSPLPHSIICHHCLPWATLLDKVLLPPFLAWVLLQRAGWWEVGWAGVGGRWARPFPCSPAQPPGYGSHCGAWGTCPPMVVGSGGPSVSELLPRAPPRSRVMV